MDRRMRGMQGFAGRRPAREQEDPNRQFDQLEASSLFCPKCKTAVPVRKRLLLVLPDGDRYEYLCPYCSTSVGRKIEETGKPLDMILKP